MAKIAKFKFVKRSIVIVLLLISSTFSPLLLQKVNAETSDNSDDVYVALSNGSRFLGTGTQWNDNFCTGKNVCEVGDVNGDGKEDIVSFVRTTSGPDDSDVYVALSDGTKFGAPQKWQDYGCTLDEICKLGDANGDGKDDIIVFVRTSGRGNDDDVYVILSDGTKFGNGLIGSGQKWNDYFCTLDEICDVGDFNGDGKADIISFVRTSGRGNDDDAYVALSDGVKFGEGQKWHDYLCTLDEICKVADVNGDGKDDAIVFVRTSGRGNDDDVYVILSDGTKFGNGLIGSGQKWNDYFCTLDEICDVGDFNGDGKADIISFIRTSGRGNDDAYVALSDGVKFGEGQKWHDYLCTLQENCKAGDVNGDGKVDAVVFTRTRDDFAVNARTIDLTVSLYNTPADRIPYISIMENFADAIYEMSNGAHRIGKVTIFQNGQNSNTADVVWVSNVWPYVPGGCISGRGRSGCQVNMGDIFPFPPTTGPYNALLSSHRRGAGYTLGHEWGHYYYGIYDEYRGKAKCDDRDAFYSPQTCDSMPNSVMDSHWNASGGNFDWLNFGIAANQTNHNVTWRVYGASGWEVLARSPNQDPRDGQRSSAASRTHYPELAGVAPTNNFPSSIELPTSNARGVLQVIWIDPPLTSYAVKANSANGYTPALRLTNGSAILYPEAAVLVATLGKDDGFVAKSGITGTVIAPDHTKASLAFKDDGIAPDSLADDGLYTASWLYKQNGLHHVNVEFNNASGSAEVTYKGNHFIPDPGGEEYNPAPKPITETFSEQVSLDVTVNGYPPSIGAPLLPLQLTTDNLDFPGRIDSAGDKDTFTFTILEPGEVVIRLTELDLEMQPHIRIFKGANSPSLIGDYQFTPSGNSYFFTKLSVEAQDNFTVEVSHIDPNAPTGLFNISVGSALPNQTEQATQALSVYLPLVTK